MYVRMVVCLAILCIGLFVCLFGLPKFKTTCVFCLFIS